MRTMMALARMNGGLGWWPARFKCPPGFAPGFDPSNPGEPSCIEKVGIVPQPMPVGTPLTVSVSDYGATGPAIVPSPIPGGGGLLIQPSWGFPVVAFMSGRRERRRGLGWWPSRFKCPPGFAPGLDPSNPNEPTCIEKVGIVPQPVMPGTLLTVPVSGYDTALPGMAPSPVPAGGGGLLLQPGGYPPGSALVVTVTAEAAARLLRLAESSKKIVDEALDRGNRPGASARDMAAADAVRACMETLVRVSGPFDTMLSELREAVGAGGAARVVSAQAAALEAFVDCAQAARDAR